MIHGVELKCSAAPGVVRENMVHSVSRGLPVLSARQPERAGRVAIVATGPSVSDFKDTIQNWDGDVWTVNGALDWLVKLGRVPDACVLTDYQPELARYLTNPPVGMTYYVATACHRAVLDALEGRDVVLFHLAQGDSMPPSGTYCVGGGPTALTRAPALAWCLGFREMHVFGGDSSFRDSMYAEGVDDIWGREGLPPDTIRVQVEDRVFLTHPPLLGQASYFATYADALPAKIEFHGDGFGPTFARAKINDQAARLVAR